MPKYINFILKCNRYEKDGSNYLQKLVRWKDTRDIAWSESSGILSRAGMSFEDALMKTGESGSDLNTVLEAAEEQGEDFGLPTIEEHPLEDSLEDGDRIMHGTQENLAMPTEDTRVEEEEEHIDNAETQQEVKTEGRRGTNTFDTSTVDSLRESIQ